MIQVLGTSTFGAIFFPILLAAAEASQLKHVIPTADVGPRARLLWA